MVQTDANGSNFLINVELGELDELDELNEIGERTHCFKLIPVKSLIWTKVEKSSKMSKKILYGQNWFS